MDGFWVRCIVCVSVILSGAVCDADDLGPPLRSQNAPSARPSLTVGDNAPEITLEHVMQGPSEKKATLSALRGKVVVLEFWATWCAPCVAAIPHLNELADGFDTSKVHFISITDESGQAVIDKFLTKRPISGWVALDTDRSVFSDYHVTAIPVTVIIDAKGRIAAVTQAAKLSRTMLEDAIAGRPVKAPPVKSKVPIRPGVDPLVGGSPPLFHFLLRPSAGDLVRSAMSRDAMTWMGKSPSELVRQAYGVPVALSQIDAQLPTDRYDVIASFPPNCQEQRQVVLRAAVETVFGIEARKEMQQLQVLTLSGDDTLLKQHASVSTGGSITRAANGDLVMVNGSIDDLAQSLQAAVRMPVFNEIGADGKFDIRLKWKTGDLKSLQAKLQSELGIQSAESIRPVEILVIENGSTAGSNKEGSKQ